MVVLILVVVVAVTMVMAMIMQKKGRFMHQYKMVRSSQAENADCDIHAWKNGMVVCLTAVVFTLKLVFNIFSEYQGCYSDGLSVSLKDPLWMMLWMGIVGELMLEMN